MPLRVPEKRYGRNVRSQTSSFKPFRSKAAEVSVIYPTDTTSRSAKSQATQISNNIDDLMGFSRYESGKTRLGWLCNMHSTTIEDANGSSVRAGVDYYFLEEDGGTFKATVEYDPYFLIAVKLGKEAEVEEWCRRKFEGLVKSLKRVNKEDLQMPNHLLGYRRTFLQISFKNVGDLLEVRKVIMPIAEKNRRSMDAMDTYAEVVRSKLIRDESSNDERADFIMDASDYVIDIREYDVPYHVRVSIDKGIRVGKWYSVEAKYGSITLTCVEERIQRADPVVLAYDIETTKSPLKFPDPVMDQIMMISYMIDGQGFLITNREVVSEDIADFEYTPKPEYDGPFLVFNEQDERATIERFFSHIRDARPTVIATYNGDFFDWPFVEARAGVLGIDMYQEIGFRKNSEDVYQSACAVHMDCFSWVSRDSYLPQGSRGLKAVTVAKLGYDPDELDPELMTQYAKERPQVLAEYSVSDAVATYYLYMKYIHPFIFSLCTIIPLNPDDVLRKGTGTLCEMLLMVQAYENGIVLPNKHKAPREAFWDGHLLESETYVGGHVESIEAGVFRSDIPVDFSLDIAAIDELVRNLDSALQFSIVVEEKKSMGDILNYDEVKAEIIGRLHNLKSMPNRNEEPSIYHLDVASMYPNIMTTNRLQPDSMIQESDCAACDFNRPGKTCDRRLPWSWRGEFLPAQKNEYNMVKHALESELFPGQYSKSFRTFEELGRDEQAALVKKRLQDYSKKIYHKIHDTKTIEREAIICQRENPFYVNTVRNFRDRRYDFKGKQKQWKSKAESLKSSRASIPEIEEANKMIVLYDSLQLAHKVILNSFYGYVMRKGSRWYSMEMAGVTCLTGAHIIQMARELIERIGRPLELDTDGIWCMLPSTFPENLAFTLKNGKKLTISYPCVILNHLVHEKFTNHQYQDLIDPVTFRYETRSDNSIFFEVDGPYKAMILPTSKEEDKNLKKRYAVFNHDGSLAELKGFEVKRRGELKLIKIFQTQIFKFFLDGITLEETYTAVAKVANQWLDVLYQHGSTLADEELIDLICENRSMSKALQEYGSQKSTSITTAKRLAEFLGTQMVKDKGLNCKYIISSRPKNAPVTDRAVPVAIFSAESSVKRYFLRKWTREEPSDMNPRAFIDWDYYLERLSSVIQKLITIPAALQKVRNPVPRVSHPDWLQRRINIKDDRFKQKKMTDLFKKTPLSEITTNTIDNQMQLNPDSLDSSYPSKSRNDLASRVTQKRKAADLLPSVNLDPFSALPPKMPSMTQDYQGFLSFQKKKWKFQKEARLRRRQLFGESNNTASDTLKGLFRSQTEILYSSNWQVLQLRESANPGDVKAFILINKRVHALSIKVTRQLFLNLSGKDLPTIDIDGCAVEKVNHTLPNGHTSMHLFKISMPEDVYIKETQRLTAMFSHPSVEGVYEKQIPMTIRAILHVGNICTFDESQPGVLGKGLEHGFDLSVLHRTTAERPYLQDIHINYIFLYHLAASERDVYAVFSTTRAEAHLIIQDPKKHTQNLKNVAKIYAELLERKLKAEGQHQSGILEYPNKLNVATTLFMTKRKAYLELGRVIMKMRNDETKPSIIVIQSPQRHRLVHDLPVLDNLPVLPLKTEPTDSNLPPLGWEASAAKIIVTRYLALGPLLSRLTGLARYGEVPLCNLERDDPRFLIDIAYARRLQRANVVLWWSEKLIPDHAGHEKDDILNSFNTVEMPVTNHSGTYSSVCIELDVRNLAINTILTSSLLNEVEGIDSIAFNPAASAENDMNNGVTALYCDFAFASTGVAVLREMVKAWWTEACKGSDMADIMVQHLLRWVDRPDSFLYDRSLSYYVQTMSSKAFHQLTADFRRTGCYVVFANTNRLLLQTTKAEVGTAHAYGQYIVKAIKAKPLFHFLDIEIKEYWDFLVWYDQFNYGGKACQEVVETGSQPLQTIMHWQLSSFIPTAYQRVFHDWIVEFIDLMHSRKTPHQQVDGNPPSNPHPTQLYPFKPTSTDDAETVNQDLLARSISKPLKRQILALISRHQAELNHASLMADHAFPQLPGSHLDLQNTHPVLQLVKSIMHVFMLDQTIHMEVRLLRQDLLALFDIKAFSQQAHFENPSRSLRLEQLICEHCTMARDLDLCRDEDILPLPVARDSTPPGAAATTTAWHCLTCGHEYDRLAIEEKFIARVHKALVQWHTQDLRCRRCGRIRANAFMEHCGCSGEWSASVSRDTLVGEMKVLQRVAGFYGLRMLGEVVDEMLDGI